jgi:hypothetical protein
MKDYQCSMCSTTEVPILYHGRSALLTHQKEVHGVIGKGRYSKKDRLPAMDAILAGVQQIRDALKDVDTERNILQQKLLDLDNLAAKYRKLI